MASVSETIVREFFETHGFLVCQPCKRTAAGRAPDEDIDFFVSNPAPLAGNAPLPLLLGPGDLPRIARAVVAVKAWHTEVFSPSVLTRAPEILRFLEPKMLRRAVDFFGAEARVAHLLVVPALPRATEARDQTLEILRARDVDAVIPFHTILRDLIDGVEPNRNYQKSDLLQILRILKNYDFFKEPQLDLFRTKRKQPPRAKTQKAMP